MLMVVRQTKMEPRRADCRSTRPRRQRRHGDHEGKQRDPQIVIITGITGFH